MINWNFSRILQVFTDGRKRNEPLVTPLLAQKSRRLAVPVILGMSINGDANVDAFQKDKDFR